MSFVICCLSNLLLDEVLSSKYMLFGTSCLSNVLLDEVLSSNYMSFGICLSNVL